ARLDGEMGRLETEGELWPAQVRARGEHRPEPVRLVRALLAVVEDEGEVRPQARAVDALAEGEHDGERALHVGGAAAEDAASFAAGGKVAFLERHGVEMSEEDDAGPLAGKAPEDHRAPDALHL